MALPPLHRPWSLCWPQRSEHLSYGQPLALGLNNGIFCVVVVVFDASVQNDSASVKEYVKTCLFDLFAASILQNRLKEGKWEVGETGCKEFGEGKDKRNASSGRRVFDSLLLNAPVVLGSLMPVRDPQRDGQHEDTGQPNSFDAMHVSSARTRRAQMPLSALASSGWGCQASPGCPSALA